jgi:hypothetical protein
MLKRTWIITGEVTRDDLEWVLRSKLSFMPGEQEYFAFSDIGTGTKVPMKVAGRSEPPTIITTNEKEETWLKLYFADRAILLAEEVTYKYE